MCAVSQVLKNANGDVEIKLKRFVLTPDDEIPHLVLIASDEHVPEAKHICQRQHMLPTRRDKKAVSDPIFCDE
jgi:hypothetical protein